MLNRNDQKTLNKMFTATYGQDYVIPEGSTFKNGGHRKMVSLDDAIDFIFFRAKIGSEMGGSGYGKICMQQSRAAAWLFSKDRVEPPMFDDPLCALDYLGVKYVVEDGYVFYGKTMKTLLAEFRRIKRKIGFTTACEWMDSQDAKKWGL
jgi:hypothetical protein